MSSRDERPELHPEAQEQALAALFLAAARPTAWLLGGIYMALSLAKSFLYAAPGQLLNLLSAIDAAVSVTFFLLALALRQASAASRWAQPLAFAASAVLLADSVVTMHLLFKPLETTVFVLLAVAASLVFTSPLWFHLTLAMTVLGWGLAVLLSAPGPLLSPGAPWVELGITVFAAALASALMFRTRRRSYLRLEALRSAEARHATELEAAVAALRGQQEKLEALISFRTDFINAVTHDMRNPLTSLKGFTELLLDSPSAALSEQERGYLVQMEKSTRRLDRLIEDMLDLARIESGNFALTTYPEDFGRVVRDLAESFRPQAVVGQVALSVSVPDEALEVEMDIERIERVVGNLLANAIKFTRAGGRIEVRARLEGDRLVCEVADTGIGISTEELPLLFQRFSQLEPGRRTRGGTGLGLSISKAIVEAHGGEIGVASHRAQGSTFWFSLPLRQSQ